MKRIVISPVSMEGMTAKIIPGRANTTRTTLAPINTNLVSKGANTAITMTTVKTWALIKKRALTARVVQVNMDKEVSGVMVVLPTLKAETGPRINMETPPGTTGINMLGRDTGTARTMTRALESIDNTVTTRRSPMSGKRTTCSPPGRFAEWLMRLAFGLL